MRHVALPFLLDSGAARRVAALVRDGLGDAVDRPPREGGDGVTRWARELLRCPELALVTATSTAYERPAASLDATCNRK